MYSAHGRLYDDDADTDLAFYNWYYNNGSTGGTPTPGTRVVIVPTDITEARFYVSFSSTSTTGTLSDVTLTLWRLGPP